MLLTLLLVLIQWWRSLIVFIRPSKPTLLLVKLNRTFVIRRQKLLKVRRPMTPRVFLLPLTFRGSG